MSLSFEKTDKRIADADGRALFRATARAANMDGASDWKCFLKGWSALLNKGYKVDTEGMWKLNTRGLIAIDEKCSQIPFPHDAYALGRLRPDQMPRMLGAITHPEIQDRKIIAFSDLIAIQNRVDTAKVNSLADEPDAGPVGVVARFEGKFFILDGHHRLVGRWLRGDDNVETYFIDLTPVSNALKSKDSQGQYNIFKVDEEKHVVWGWASVVEIGGKPVVDWHGSIITEEDILKAAHKFMTDHRASKVMHEGEAVGEVVESLVFTNDLQKALGIDLGKVGWFIGAKIQNPESWHKYKTGVYKMFSIGGRAERIDNDA